MMKNMLYCLHHDDGWDLYVKDGVYTWFKPRHCPVVSTEVLINDVRCLRRVETIMREAGIWK